jgi:large subunit GTPase 1
VARGFFTQGQGNPDETRTSRFILKDYVSARLLYCHPPPGVDSDEFNRESRDLERLGLLERLRRKRAPTTRVGKSADTFIPLPEESGNPGTSSAKSQALDRNFFADKLAARPFVKGVAANAALEAAGAGTARPAHYVGQMVVGDDGVARKISPADAAAGSGKKHHKGHRRKKQRSGRGYD